MLSMLEKRDCVLLPTHRTCKQSLKLLLDRTSNLPCSLFFILCSFIYASWPLSFSRPSLLWGYACLLWLLSLHVPPDVFQKQITQKTPDAPITQLCTPVMLEVLSYATSVDIALFSVTSHALNRFVHSQARYLPQLIKPPGRVLTLASLADDILLKMVPVGQICGLTLDSLWIFGLWIYRVDMLLRATPPVLMTQIIWGMFQFSAQGLFAYFFWPFFLANDTLVSPHRIGIYTGVWWGAVWGVVILAQKFLRSHTRLTIDINNDVILLCMLWTVCGHVLSFIIRIIVWATLFRRCREAWPGPWELVVFVVADAWNGFGPGVANTFFGVGVVRVLIHVVVALLHLLHILFVITYIDACFWLFFGRAFVGLCEGPLCLLRLFFQLSGVAEWERPHFLWRNPAIHFCIQACMQPLRDFYDFLTIEIKQRLQLTIPSYAWHELGRSMRQSIFQTSSRLWPVWCRKISGFLRPTNVPQSLNFGLPEVEAASISILKEEDSESPPSYLRQRYYLATPPLLQASLIPLNNPRVLPLGGLHLDPPLRKKITSYRMHPYIKNCDDPVPDRGPWTRKPPPVACPDSRAPFRPTTVLFLMCLVTKLLCWATMWLPGLEASLHPKLWNLLFETRMHSQTVLLVGSLYHALTLSALFVASCSIVGIMVGIVLPLFGTVPNLSKLRQDVAKSVWLGLGCFVVATFCTLPE